MWDSWRFPDIWSTLQLEMVSVKVRSVVVGEQWSQDDEVASHTREARGHSHDDYYLRPPCAHRNHCWCSGMWKNSLFDINTTESRRCCTFVPHSCSSLVHIHADCVHLAINPKELEPVLNVQMCWRNWSISHRTVRPSVAVAHPYVSPKHALHSRSPRS